ncbi:phosphotriesterase-related protein-like [Ischnura elegans]|uniref:phosphotriesterase-related protein-like n=1 Tax=Ischnura elegans TaxID=197161 RepID=UPI001ED8B5D9|nr:phosphotriesterase-related protein-like [Ischnura elegans]
MVAKIQTVLGEVQPDTLGRTLTHEHLFLDLTWAVSPLPTQLEDKLGGLISLQNLGFIRQYPYHNKYNLAFYDQDTYNAQLKDLDEYRKSGGLTIVENSCHGLGRRSDLMKDVSEKTKVNIVAGTGFYLSCTQKENTLNLSVEQLSDIIRKDITEGCGEDPSVKCGFIGEVGCSWPIDAFEKKSILATAAIQEELNCPASFHPGRHPDAPFEIIRMHLEAGGRKDKTVMSHLDSTFTTESELLDFAELGTFCQFDLFGSERSFYVLNSDWEMPSDTERLQMVKHLVGKGLLDRILISHDIHSKHRLVQFGGHGYCHINYDVMPKMKRKGMTQEEIDHITIKNPAKWLSF